MRIVWTNGCFDIMHPGHIELFKACKTLGDRLIVGVDTDAKVSADKGPKRPVNPLAYRIAMLESIKYIDEVLVVGGDWRRGDVVGREFAKDTRFFNRIGGYSTTKFIDKIIDGDYR